MPFDDDIVLHHIASADTTEQPRKPISTRLLLDLMHILYENDASMPVLTRAISRFLEIYTYYVIDAYATNAGLNRHDTALATWDIPDINFLEHVSWKSCYTPDCPNEEVHACYWHRSCGNVGCKDHMHIITRPNTEGVNKYVHLCGTCVLICEIFTVDMVAKGVTHEHTI